MRIVILAAALIAVPAIAADVEAPKPAKEKKICQPSRDTGSRLGGVICKTAAEWEAERNAVQNDMTSRRRRDVGN